MARARSARSPWPRCALSGSTRPPEARHRCPPSPRRCASLSGRAAVDIEIKNIPGEPDFDPERELAVEAVHRGLDEVGFVGRRDRVELQPVVDRRQPGRPPGDRRPDCSPSTRSMRPPRSDSRPTQGHSWVLPFVGKVTRRDRRSPGRCTPPACCSARGSPTTPRSPCRSRARALTRSPRMTRGVSRPRSRRPVKRDRPSQGAPGGSARAV